MSFEVLQDDIFFIRLKLSDQKKGNYLTVVILSLFSTIRGTKLKVNTCATTLTKITFPGINCNVKETQRRLLEKERAMQQKSDISLQGKLQEFFRAGLNEIKYDYVDSKQHFYLQYHVAATDMKSLRKKTNDA